MRRAVMYTLAACVAAWACPAWAQQSVDYASVSGRVTDRSAAVIAAADVRARHTGTNVTMSTRTDGEGRFRFPYLRVGPYEVTMRADGFQPVTRTLTLSAGSAFDLPVVLEIGGLDAVVTVAGETPVIEASRSQIAGTVSRREIEGVPLNGRQFLDLALLIPGVAPANIASTQLFPETSAVPGVSLSVGAQRNLSNNFIVDGLSANDDAAGLSGMTYSVDAVEELQVVTSGGQAELGRALGGYLNVVTKSGTNVVRGSLYDYTRHDRLSAANALSGDVLPMSQWQFGASLGGPLVRDRTFYFASAERRQLDQSGLVTIAPASVDAINARLAQVGYAGPSLATGVYPSPMQSTNLLGKVDHHASGRVQLSLRYSLYDVRAEHSRGAGALSATSASTGLDSLDQAIAAGGTLVLSPRTVLETRGQVAHSDLAAPASDPIGPAVSIAGVASFGTSASSPTGRVNTLYQGVANLSHQAGAHALRVGVDVVYNDDRITYPRAVRGSYAFSSLQNFLNGTYNNAGFTQTFGTSEVSQGSTNLGIYAQDEWKIGARVTLNLGLRYDLQVLETIQTDRNNVSPRLGVAWLPFDSRRTVIRGNAGLFYDRVPLRPLANALLSAGNTTDLANLQQIGVSLSPAQTGAPVFPETLPGVVPSVTLVNLTTMDRELENAYSRQSSVEVEQQVGDRATVSAGYHYVRGLKLLMAVNQNVPACVASGTNNGCRPNPAYANNNQYSSVGDSSSHALHLSWLQRPARWGSYRVSYTLSKAMNNVGQFFFSAPIDPFDLSKDWGRADDDRRHRLVMSGNVQSSMDPATGVWSAIANGFVLSGVLQAYSAGPLNIVSGVTTIQGTAGRPIVDGAFIERNAGEGGDVFSLNVRLSRGFRAGGRVRLEAIAEAFNLTNHVNVLTRNANFGPGSYPDAPSPAFGQVTAVGEPRTLQLGVRASF